MLDEDGNPMLTELSLPEEEREKILEKLNFHSDVLDTASQFQDLTLRVKTRQYEDITDCHQLDSSIPEYLEKLSKEVKLYRIELRDSLPYSYVGHVYVWTHEKLSDFVGMYGIKGSVLNHIIKSRKGITSALLKVVAEFAVARGRTKILIPWPLDAMKHQLVKKGFIEHNRDSSDPKYYEFMTGFTGSCQIYVGSVDLIFGTSK